MGRYTGPKARVNRRLGMPVFESGGALRAAEKREYPPGMSQKRRKLSNYGLALAEKQKIKYYYGMREQQLRRYFDRARKMPGNTGENLLVLCERRLDNIVRRAGFVLTRPQARQGIVHSHFQVNGKTVSKPSMVLRPGDVVTVRDRSNLKALYSGIVEATPPQRTDWISFDVSTLTATLQSMPTREDVSLPVDVGQVVAFMSR